MTAPVEILIVDDEPGVRTILREGLEAAGFAVTEAWDKDSLLRSLETRAIRLITLDLGLSDGDSLEFAREIRAAHNVPIIMITGRDSPIDRVLGLEHGADDYISKPFHIREVVMRIRSVLRRYELEAGEPGAGSPRGGETALRYSFNHTVFDAAKREVKRADGTVVGLTELECRLLELFARCPARVLSRDEIWQALRGRDWSPMDRAIDGHVARLRRKIEPLGEAPMLIKSVRGVGYVFAGEVRRS